MFGKKILVLMVAAMFLALGCAKDAGEGSTSSIGTVNMAVVMDDASEITSVHWAIADSAAMVIREGDIDVSDPSAVISTYIAGIPAGTGYTMTLTAMLLDENDVEIGGCLQTATFDVVAGQVTKLNMTLNCTLNATTGVVEIDAKANLCPVIDYMTVTPLVQAVGSNISLMSEASDGDNGDIVTYAWTATVGTVNNDDMANTTYTCSALGEIDITLTVIDSVSDVDDELPCDVKATVTVTCVSAAVCGDGIIGAGEQCDDSNTNSEDGCSYPNCRIENCGDGIIQEGLGENCELPNVGTCGPSCTIVGCGNGNLDPGEGCDDGNLNSCDGCSASCQMESCGNGVMECGEACDDGNSVSGDACEPDCTIPVPPCTQCAMTNCMNYKGDDVYSACYTDVTNGTLCSDLMDCARSTGCVLEDPTGTPWAAPNPNKCYCGTADTMACMTGSANGECKALVEAAAGTTNPMDIGTRFADPAFAVGDAMGLMLCEMDFCADLCL